MATGYGSQQYWEERYKSQANSYEWYMPWETLKPDCLPHFHATHALQPDAAATGSSSHQHLTLAEQRKAIAKADAAAAASAKSNAVPESAASASSSSSSAASASASAGSSSSAEVAPIPAAPAAPAAICPLCLSSRLLIVGCGNSELSEHLWRDGFTSQLSVDYSEVVIAKMRELYAATPALASTFLVGDCRDLKSLAADGMREGGCFEVIIDKGTLDAIMCGADSNKNAAAMIAEMHRLLRPGGVLLVITYGQPTARLPHLERKQYQWTVTQQSLGPTRYMYVCKKRMPKNTR